MKKIIIFFLLIFIFLAIAQTIKIDQEIIARIKEEALQHSQVMELTSYLADVYGPRVAGTPEYFAAAQWAAEQLKSWGIKNVTLDQIDSMRSGWRMDAISIEMVKPYYSPIWGYARAGCRSTAGELVGEPVVVGNIFHEDSLKKYSNIIKDRIVLIDLRKPILPNFQPLSHRWSEEELKEAERSLIPFPEKPLNKWEDRLPLKDRFPGWQDEEQQELRLQKLLLEASPAVLIEPSDRMYGVVRVDEIYLGKDRTIKPVPAIVIANEQFYRLIRMIEKGVKPTLKINLQTTFFDNPKYQVNVLGEIPGRDNKLSSERVLIGAHLDSWQAGTGAADNAVNCAVMMEVMRILQTLQLPLRRTVGIGLWTGEEVGYLGSRDYVEKRVGNIRTGKLNSVPQKISVYLNLDNGAGKIRGLFLQGNEAARILFRQLLQPLADWDATTLTIQSTTYTDHEVFDVLNIPAFQFIQDPLNYLSIVHHSNMDVYDYLIEDDVKQNAAIIAALVYHLANMDEMVPRKRVK